VVPELVTAQQDHYPKVRECATNALRKIAPEVLTNGVRGILNFDWEGEAGGKEDFKGGGNG
jgi:hypothetical protein